MFCAGKRLKAMCHAQYQNNRLGAGTAGSESVLDNACRARGAFGTDGQQLNPRHDPGRCVRPGGLRLADHGLGGRAGQRCRR